MAVTASPRVSAAAEELSTRTRNKLAFVGRGCEGEKSAATSVIWDVANLVEDDDEDASQSSNS
jgi:hypothetical protein